MPTTPTDPSGPTRGEFVALMALLISLPALSTDAILPALADIGRELALVDDNDRQWVITALFIGLALAQLIYGPLADSYGRRWPIFAGLGVFVAGCLLSALAESFALMLFGRFLQGVGAAGPRIVTMALVRDQYRGDEMARIMSLIMAVFIVVPTVAPALGQLLLWFAHWRAIFIALTLQALLALVWFALRQPETLAAERRAPLTFRQIGAAAAAVIAARSATIYTLAAGLVFGAFVGFLISVQQILQEQYRLGDRFALYFAALALTIGAASYLNSQLVMHYGMRVMSRRALLVLTALSFAFWLYAALSAGHPPLAALMGFLLIAFACIGVLMGNLNALAMEPLGHVAGMAAAVIGSATTLISLALGALVGLAYDGTVLPLSGGFALLSLAALAAARRAEKTRPPPG